MIKKKKVVLVGGAGAMCASCAYDLHKTSQFDEIIIADADEKMAKYLIDLMDGDKRFSYVRLDARNKDEIVEVIKEVGYVVGGLPFKYAMNFLEAVLEVGEVVCVDLNGVEMDKVLKMSSKFEEKNCILFYGNGGLVITSFMSMLGCEEMDEVEEINIYWGMWRPITHTSPGLTATVFYEFDPKINERIVYEKGELCSLPPFALLREFSFPDPIGKQETYVLAHPEPITLPMASIIKEKRVRRIVARGVWPSDWTMLIRTLLETGIYEAEPVQINGDKVRPIEVIINSIKPETDFKDPYELSKEIGWSPRGILSTEIVGYRKGVGHRIVYHTVPPYPFFDGKPTKLTMEYGCYVGVPLSVTLQMMARNEFKGKGVIVSETSTLSPREFFREMEKRGFKLIKEGSSQINFQ